MRLAPKHALAATHSYALNAGRAQGARMHNGSRAIVGAIALIAVLTVTGCASTVPQAPDAVGDDYPGTCMPGEFTWPTDFLEALPSESPAVGGPVVGLRLEYIGSEWVWRLHSTATRVDMFGERVDDPSFGKESIVDVRTMQPIASHDVQLTDAEQQTGSGAFTAAQSSGEQWPSPLIVEMSRVIDDGVPMWQITTCDTETNELSVMTAP